MQGFRLRVTNNGKATFFVAVNGTQKRLDSDTIIERNRWYHLVVAVDGTDARMYINTVLQSDVEATGNVLTPSTVAARIGDDVSAAGVIHGNIKSIRFFSRKLTADEVFDLKFHLTVPGGLAEAWLLNDASGATATGQNGNNGIITGAVWSFDVPNKWRVAV